MSITSYFLEKNAKKYLFNPQFCVIFRRQLISNDTVYSLANESDSGEESDSQDYIGLFSLIYFRNARKRFDQPCRSRSRLAGFDRG